MKHILLIATCLTLSLVSFGQRPDGFPLPQGPPALRCKVIGLSDREALNVKCRSLDPQYCQTHSDDWVCTNETREGPVLMEWIVKSRVWPATGSFIADNHLNILSVEPLKVARTTLSGGENE